MQYSKSLTLIVSSSVSDDHGGDLMVATAFNGWSEPIRQTIYDVNVTLRNLEGKYFTQNGLARCILKPI